MKNLSLFHAHSPRRCWEIQFCNYAQTLVKSGSTSLLYFIYILGVLDLQPTRKTKY